jgi:hypothetical protein
MMGLLIMRWFYLYLFPILFTMSVADGLHYKPYAIILCAAFYPATWVVWCMNHTITLVVLKNIFAWFFA